MNNRPDWQILIRHWTRGSGIGYTLPFLVGARALTRGTSRATVDDARILLDEMFHPQAHSDVLQVVWCPNLDAPVFGLNKESIPGETITSAHSGAPSVIVRSDILRHWGPSVEEVIAGIIAHSQEALESGRFSRTWDQKWELFSDTEVSRIRNLLGHSGNGL